MFHTIAKLTKIQLVKFLKSSRIHWYHHSMLTLDPEPLGEVYLSIVLLIVKSQHFWKIYQFLKFRNQQIHLSGPRKTFVYCAWPRVYLVHEPNLIRKEHLYMFLLLYVEFQINLYKFLSQNKHFYYFNFIL